MRILIADDSATARFFCIRCLGAAGCLDAEFIEAADGSEALALLKGTPFDLLVTDLMMPTMDGIDLMRHIQASPKLHGLPVIVVSRASPKVGTEENAKSHSMTLVAFNLGIR